MLFVVNSSHVVLLFLYAISCFPRLMFPRLVSFQQFRLDYFYFSPAYIVCVLRKPTNLGLTN
jgi:hypothetical protein